MRVLIVGAGIIGCAIAHELARRGVDVRVVDRRGIGQGATRASAGILAPHIEGHHEPLLRLGISSLSLYDEFIHQVARDASQSIEYRRIGTLQVALTPEEAARLETAAARLAMAGASHEFVGSQALRLMEPGLSRAIVAGLVTEAHGYVGAASLMSALRAAGERLGVTWIAGTVRAIDRGDAGLRVQMEEGALDADAVVLAAGSWSGQIELRKGPAVPVRPIRGQLLHLRGADLAASRVIWGERCYMVPWSDGSLLVGATMEDVGFDESASAEATAQLMDAARELLPSVSQASLAGVYVGLRPATSDGLPLIGASSTIPGVFHATGHFRNGVLLAPLTATLLADLIVEGSEGPDLALVRPDRAGL